MWAMACMLVVLLLLALIDFIQFVCASMCRWVGGVWPVLMFLLTRDRQRECVDPHIAQCDPSRSHHLKALWIASAGGAHGF